VGRRPAQARRADELSKALPRRVLLAGNCRCITSDGIRSIKDTLHGDIDASSALYEGLPSSA
jgi:hypothetical protein